MSTQGSTMDQPIDFIEGIISGNGLKGLSANMKSTVTFIRAQITRSFTAAGKKLDAAKIYMNDPDVNRNEKELRKIDVLRKEVMKFQSIIDTDAHFIDLINKREVILSEKERNALKHVIASYFDEKPRAEVSHDLKIANEELRAILASQDFQFAPLLSDAELAELSHELASFLNDNCDDKTENGDNDVEVEGSDIRRHSQEDSKETPILNAAPPACRSNASITIAPSINGGLIENTDQPVVTPQLHQSVPQGPIEHQPVPQGPVEKQSLTVPSTKCAYTSNSPPQGTDIDRCPCCSSTAHKIETCEHLLFQRYCARNGLCIYCASDRHRSIECDLAPQRSTPASSIISTRTAAGTRFLHPRDATTHGFGHIPENQPRSDVSCRGASRRERERKIRSGLPCSASYRPLPKDPNVGAYEDARKEKWNEGRKVTNPGDSVDMSFKEVDAIITPFVDDPTDYHRFTDMIQNMVISNSRLNDTMKFVLLKKKLAGTATRHLVELMDSRKGLSETMKSIHRTFSENNTAINSLLRQFQNLTFDQINLNRTLEELDLCKSLILRIKDYEVDVDSELGVRSLLSKLPRKVVKETRILYRSGNKPTLAQIIDCCTDVLEDLTFWDRFNSGHASASKSGQNYSFRGNSETHE